ncbi:AraC family transcriptional regulator [Paenibacillus sp. N4]|uniref:helix-turn-helix transcriptional regulator n=1 Tax=Paenibacillus vietnamensis TaxID=2590547 RepID=UPI001CD0453C|nr:AraC family transcriptional regulator [Paenibacillus vietnamensis]MCA0757943.1 AraC family transcriptional regulator [Paenibacillus vietnamensis]
MKAIVADRVKLAPGFWSSLRLLGISPQEVARHARLPLTVIDDPAVTTAQYYAIWQAYAELVGDAATGIVKLATAFETAQYPPAALATFHARDFRDALTRMTRYKQMCPPESLCLREEGEHGVVELDWQHAAKHGPPVLVGMTLAYLLELGRRGTGQPLTAHSVEFVHNMGNTEVLEVYFGCSVRVGAFSNRLTLHGSDLDRPFISYNEELLDILTPALDRSLDKQRSKRKISNNVKWILSGCLSRGRIDIQTVANEMGLSDRTLQRRLSAEGASFKQLLAQTRHEQALAYLADPTLEIKEIAFLVGYEDQNSFYRAFRSWEGETPANWRAAQDHWRSSLVTK